MPQLTWFVPIGMVVDTDTARRFGSEVAEAPIQDRMKYAAALGKPGDYGLFADDGTDDSDEGMYVFIARHNNLPTERITEMRNYRNSRAKGEWSRPDALVHTLTAREYYEIKPESAPSIGKGWEKLPNIDEFIRHFQLPYSQGKTYLPHDGDTDEAPLLDNNGSFRADMQALQTSLSLRSIRLFLHWERPRGLHRDRETPRDGLIVYRVKVTVETEGPAPPNFPLQELAHCVVKLGIRAALPGALVGASATSALAAVLGRISGQLNQLRLDLETSMRLHQSLLNQAAPGAAQMVTAAAGLLIPGLAIPTLVNIAVNPTMRPVVGAGVQMLNPAKCTLEIWKLVQEALAAGEAAVQARNAAKALAQLAAGQASYVKASQQLAAFQDGTELAARRAQLLIGVTAAAAALAAVVAFSATGATATAGFGVEAATAGSTQARVRVAAQLFEEGIKRIALAESPDAFDEGVRFCEEDAPKALMRAVMPRPT